MVVLRIKELAITNPADHLATDWQVSKTLAFNDIVLESLGDTDSITHKKWNDVLDPNVQYYARARALIKDRGYTHWGNLDIYHVDSVNDLTFSTELPSKVSIPTLTTDSDVSAHDVTLFKLKATGFGVLGGSSHVMTTWIIEDQDGVTIWSSADDRMNKEEIIVSDCILEKNTLYRVRAMFKSNTGDTSQFATMSICVTSPEEVEIVTYLNSLDPTIDNELSIFARVDITDTTWGIIAIDGRNSEVVWESSINDTKITLPANTLKSGVNYMLKVKTNVSDRYEYAPFRLT